VLSNDQLRAKYDRNGLEATKDAQLIDSHVFFTMLFGSDRFEPFVGQLALSTMAEVWMNEGTLGVKECERMQIQREVRCALNLADVLQRFLDTRDEVSFEACMAHEAGVLVNTPFGEELLHAIGWVYANKADQWLGFHGDATPLTHCRTAPLKPRNTCMSILSMLFFCPSSSSRVRCRAACFHPPRCRRLVPELGGACGAAGAAHAHGGPLHRNRMGAARHLDRHQGGRRGVGGAALGSAANERPGSGAAGAGKHGRVPAHGAQSGLGHQQTRHRKDPAARLRQGGDRLCANMSHAWFQYLLSVTLLPSCHPKPTSQVLEDHGKPLEERAARARALRIAGRAFLAATGSDARSRGVVDAKGHIDRAMKATQAAAQGQDYDPSDFDGRGATADRGGARAQPPAAEQDTSL
jgi:hypothetical protein